MFNKIEVKINGVAPLLMHNGATADPLSHWAKELKKVAGKRTKTEADHIELARVEWNAGLYTDGEKIVVPGTLIEMSIINAAKKSRKGKQAESGVIIEGNIPLQFPDAGKPLDKLYALGRYEDRRMVRIQKNAVARTRPRFDTWSLSFVVNYDDELLNKSELIDMIDVAGQLCGIGDYRPKFGRFERV